MIPQRLQISGFLSYLEPAILDFTSIDLACISGSNGAGKSSLLDAITWVLFGKARKSNDAIINSKAKQAEVILEFLYENNRYRVQRIKPRGKTGQLEFFIHSGENGWRPITGSSMSETEKIIESTLRMDYDTFTNASFFLQGKADLFAQQSARERKQILSTILGLEVWEGYREAAAEKRKALEREADRLQGQINQIQEELALEPERRKVLAQGEESLARQTTICQTLEKKLETDRRLQAALKAHQDNVALLKKRADQTSSELADVESQILQRQPELQRIKTLLADESDIRAAHAAWQIARQELEHWDGVSRQFHVLDGLRVPHLRALDKERTRLESERDTLHKQQKSYETSLDLINSITSDLQSLHRREAELQNGQSQRAEIRSRIEQLTGQISDLNAEKNILKARMAELNQQIKELQSTSGANCPLCGQTLSEEDRLKHLQDLQNQGTAQGDRFRTIEGQELPALQRQKQQLENDDAQLDKDGQELTGLGRQISAKEQNLSQQTAQKEQWETSTAPRLLEITVLLEQANYALEAQAALAKLDTQLSSLGYDAQAHEAARQAEQTGRASQSRFMELETARAALNPLQRELTDLETRRDKLIVEARNQREEFETARDALNAQASGLVDIETEEQQLLNLRGEENRLREQVSRARQQVDVLKVQTKKHKEFQEKREEINLQIARLKTLERAFGKDGVPALLIEQALPQIEAQANDILDRISGGGMSVRFDTQRAYADAKREDKKETLDIIISDAAGPREYELFSGGEAFRVNFAIRLALSRVLAQRAGARLQTLVIDEGFGSQDAEGRQRLIEAINLVRPEFARILVITHLEEMKDAFPARIEVEKTPSGSRVSVLTS